VSFRVEALLGIGGFWPVSGRPELRDWFTEEHHAQRELAAAGWSARAAGRACPTPGRPAACTLIPQRPQAA